MTTEMAIQRGRLGALLGRRGQREEVETFDALERLSTELHQFVTRIRLVPIAPLLRWQERAVRDIAEEEDKQVELSVLDQGVEVDTSILERLRAPLTHMVRNAVSHGIEPPRARQELGKPPLGRIELRARHQGTGIVVEIEDDGAGLDRARILEKAVALGLASGDARLTDGEIDRLIFRQGLSTARRLTGVSGRGIGMDVVLGHIEAMGGQIEVASTPGRGACFTIRMPLTVAIIDGFVVDVGGESFVIPMAGVLRCVDVSGGAGLGGSEGVLDVHGQAVPFVRLRAALSTPGEEGAEEVAVVVRVEGTLMGIVADRLVGRRQVVVKPAGPHLEGLHPFSGLTLLEDGEVAPIIHVDGLLRHWLERSGNRPERCADA